LIERMGVLKLVVHIKSSSLTTTKSPMAIIVL
jgi:hypothetical protein